jgi:ribonucleoside-diphosphate reductase alpha chain
MDDEDNKSDTKRWSLELRHGIHPKYIVKQIEKSNISITSFDKAISRVLKKYIGEGERDGDACPGCGESLIYEGGCKVCKSCGYSACS